jgi:uroporphyrinogen III methyltransferase/synthase
VRTVTAQLRDARALGSTQVAVIGPGTASALAAFGVVADLVPSRNVAEGLVDAFPVGHGRVFLPQAADARPVLGEGLRTKGWDVDTVTAYRAVAVALDDRQRARAAESDAITFTSSSTVTNFIVAAGTPSVPAVVISIGPITSATARDLGLEVSVEADPHTLDGLVDAVVRSFPRIPGT